MNLNIRAIRRLLRVSDARGLLVLHNDMIGLILVKFKKQKKCNYILYFNSNLLIIIRVTGNTELSFATKHLYA